MGKLNTSDELRELTLDEAVELQEDQEKETTREVENPTPEDTSVLKEVYALQEENRKTKETAESAKKAGVPEGETKEPLTDLQIQDNLDSIKQQGGNDEDQVEYLRSIGIVYDTPPTKRIKDRKTLSQISSGMFGDSASGKALERLTVDGVLSPLTEVARGLTKASAGAYDTLNAAAKLVEQVSFGILGSSGKFGEMAKGLQKYSDEDLPETNIVGKGLYQLVGAAPVLMAEWELAGKGINLFKPMTKRALAIGAGQKIGAISRGSKELLASGRAMTDVGKFALLGAIKEYENNHKISSLIKGGVKGAAFSMVFQSGLTLLSKFGPAVARKYISFVTKDRKLANDFINNPDKYNIGRTGKRMSAKELTAEYTTNKKVLRDGAARDFNIFRSAKARDHAIYKDKLLEKKQSMQRTLNNSQEALKENSKVTFEQAADDSAAAIKAFNESSQDDMIQIYDDALDSYKLIRDASGKEVNLAVETTIAKNPLSNVNYSDVSDDVLKVVKTGPFKVAKVPIGGGADPQGLRELAIKSGQFTQRTKTSIVSKIAGHNTADAKTFEAMFIEFQAKARDGKLTIRYLQDLKKACQSNAGKAKIAGKGDLVSFYTDLSKIVNPAKVIERTPGLARKFPEMAKANKVYSGVMDDYTKAMKQYFVEDANGNAIPNIDKAIRAAKGGKGVTERQMRKADSLLPPDQRILPRVKEIVKSMDNKAVQEKAIMKNLRDRAKMDLVRLKKSERMTMQKLAQDQKNLSRAQKDELAERTTKMIDIRRQELTSVIDGLDAKLAEQKNVEALNASLAAYGTVAHKLQNVGLLSIGGGITSSALGFQGAAGPAIGSGALLAAALSPKVASRLSAVAVKSEKFLYNVLKSPRLQRVIQEASRKKKKKAR